MTSCKDSSVLTVVDESNRPIAGAKATIQSMSIEGQPKTTQSDGKVTVNKKEVIGAKWLMISKNGYENQRFDLNRTCPEVIMLKKQNAIQPGAASDATNGRG